MKKVSTMNRVRYAFDNYMSKGTIALIGGLAILSLLVILFAAAVISVGRITQADGGTVDFGEAAWLSLTRTLDSGTFGGDTGTGFRLVMLAVTFGGVFIISALIGVLNNGLEGQIGELRKGRSRIIESNHTVILGWSPQVFAIISELVIANANQKKPCIAIMGQKDKVEMEDEIRDRQGNTGRTRIVCRSGSPINIHELEIVSLDTARSIIVLSPEGDDPDSAVIKTILAITNNPNRHSGKYHIVAEIHDERNMEVAKMVGRDEVELVQVGDLISRITVQTCRQSGLSVVYTELLDFGGDEIYFKEEPALVGQKFGDALLAYQDSTVIGLRPAGGGALLNPPMDRRIGPGDQLIAISEDDDTLRLSGVSDFGIDPSAIRAAKSAKPKPERTLILGWNWRVPTIINELDNYVAPKSAVTVVADYAGGKGEIKAKCSAVKNQTVAFEQADTADRRVLDKLNVSKYDQVIAMASDGVDPQQADARTLITLLHLRDISDKGGYDFAIVSEMLDIRNRELAEVTRADDFIVSEKLVSLMLSQVSENKELNAVFADIFDPEGSEIYLKPADDFLTLGLPVNFYTVVEAARRRGAIAIGYRIKADANDAAKAYGVAVNPDKSKKISFSPGDKIVVISEN